MKKNKDQEIIENKSDKIDNSGTANEKSKDIIKATNKSNNFFKSKDGIICIALAFILVLFVVLYFLVFSNRNNDKTYEIAKEIANGNSEATLVQEPKDESLKYGCQYATLIYMKSIGSVESGEPAINIAQYNNSTEAKLRLNYFNRVYKLVHEKFDESPVSLLDDYLNLIADEKDIIYTNGVYFVRINSKLQDGERYKSLIDSIIKKYNVEDIQTATEEEISKYWDDYLIQVSNDYDQINAEFVSEFNKLVDEIVEEFPNCVNTECDEALEEIIKYEKYDNMKDGVAKVKEAYEKAINTKKNTISEIDSKIANLKKSLKRSDYNEIKNTISSLNDSYYDSYITKWETELSSIEKSVDEAERKQREKEYECRNALEKAESYASYMHMSKSAIYDQLISKYGEGFSKDAAKCAIEQLDVDWKQNALEKAKSYRDNLHMSKSAIYNQLISSYGEKFTKSEAQYAIDHLYD